MFISSKIRRAATLLATATAALPVRAAIPYIDLDVSTEGYLVVDQHDPREAFAQLARAFAETYPLTEWKSIDWDTRYDELAPQVAAAAQAEDWIEYYRLVRAFVCSAPDGHVSIYSLENGSDALAPADEVDGMHGAYGFAAMPDPEGSTRLLIFPNSAAAEAGVPSGSELVSINGIPAATALSEASTRWTNGGVATTEAERYFQGITLGRGKPGTQISLVYRPDGDPTAEVSITLEAVESENLNLPGIDRYLDAEDELLDADLIAPRTGYIRLSAFFSNEIESDEEAEVFIDTIAHAFAETLEALKEAGAEQLVLDLRGNIGGLDELGARLAGHFQSNQSLYQTSVPFDLETGWENDPFEFEREFATPATPPFSGRVVVLANHTTTSAAETFVEHLQAQPQVRYVGHWATNGSNANMGGLALLPEGILVLWPIEPCLDADGVIRIDTAAERKARLKPDVRVPLAPEDLSTLLDPARDLEIEWALLTLDDPFFGYFPGTIAGEDSWAWHERMGWLWKSRSPWAYHPTLGWLYLSDRGGDEQYFYSKQYGWCYSSTTTLPNFFSWQKGWFYLNGSSLWSYRDQAWTHL